MIPFNVLRKNTGCSFETRKKLVQHISAERNRLSKRSMKLVAPDSGNDYDTIPFKTLEDGKGMPLSRAHTKFNMAMIFKLKSLCELCPKYSFNSPDYHLLWDTCGCLLQYKEQYVKSRIKPRKGS